MRKYLQNQICCFWYVVWIKLFLSTIFYTIFCWLSNLPIIIYKLLFVRLLLLNQLWPKTIYYLPMFWDLSVCIPCNCFCIPCVFCEGGAMFIRFFASAVLPPFFMILFIILMVNKLGTKNPPPHWYLLICPGTISMANTTLSIFSSVPFRHYDYNA